MKILLIIALVFTALTVLMGFLSSFGCGNDAENAQATAGFTVLLMIIAGFFYAIWALGLLIHYLLS